LLSPPHSEISKTEEKIQSEIPEEIQSIQNVESETDEINEEAPSQRGNVINVNSIHSSDSKVSCQEDNKSISEKQVEQQHMTSASDESETSADNDHVAISEKSALEPIAEKSKIFLDEVSQNSNFEIFSANVEVDEKDKSEKVLTSMEFPSENIEEELSITSEKSDKLISNDLSESKKIDTDESDVQVHDNFKTFAFNLSPISNKSMESNGEKSTTFVDHKDNVKEESEKSEAQHYDDSFETENDLLNVCFFAGSLNVYLTATICVRV